MFLDIKHNNNRHNDTKHNDAQHNDTQHNVTQHNDTQHNNTHHNDIAYIKLDIKSSLNKVFCFMSGYFYSSECYSQC